MNCGLVTALRATLVAGSLMVGGCGAGAGARPAHPTSAQTGPVSPIEVTDAEFGQSVHQLLLDGAPSQTRMNLLAGVVRKQLGRAHARFAAGHPEAGMAALEGAFYLTRAGELRQEMLRDQSQALRAAADEVARVGNEGLAAAFYSMLESTLPQGRERTDASAHLSALDGWARATRDPRTMQGAGAEQRASVMRALFQTDADTLASARTATVRWIDRALERDTEMEPPRTPFDRDELIETYRARRAGGATLVALYLRHGDASGAVTALDAPNVSRVVPPPLKERIEALADDPNPEIWWQLYQLFGRADDPELPETALDPALTRAAAWGSAVELYRLEPNHLRGALAVADLLVRYQMPEATPLALIGALGAGAGARDLSLVLSLVLRAITEQEEIGELATARRTFEIAEPLLALAEERDMVGRTRPTASRLRFVMGALEMRGGEIERARPHLMAAIATEPSAEAYVRLAAIERQRGAPGEALVALERSAALGKASGDPLAEADAASAAFELHRLRGAAADAAKSLEAALRLALDARTLAKTPADRARAERAVARSLELHGDLAGARAATARAYDAAASDVRQIAATVLDEARRSLTRQDLAGARAALRRATDERLEAEDTVYVAIWLMLLERRLADVSDGSAAEALGAMAPAGWAGRLRAWALGKLSDSALLGAARTRVEKAEAAFYAAMSRWSVRDDTEARRQLGAVASSPATDLIEVVVARDLVADPKVAPTLPSDIVVP